MHDLERLRLSLHPLERKVLPLLTGIKGIQDLVKESGLSDTEVRRALQWLGGKGLVEVNESGYLQVNLDSNGLRYARESLPERRFVVALKSGALTLDDVRNKSGLSDEEMNISVGILRRMGVIEIGKDLLVRLVREGPVSGELDSEVFLRKKFPLLLSSLGEHEKKVLDGLKSRKGIVRVDEVKDMRASILPLGSDVLKAGIDVDVIDRVTPDIIKSGSWKGKAFRRYDIHSNVPRVFGGRKQHYRRFLEEVRQKLLSMGFTEMNGPIVETEFWNMDALFMPQFHSARDIHDAYYVKVPKYSSDLPQALVSKVKAAHEHGVAGSRGWRYSFDVKRTHRHVLRTQDTSISPRILSSPELRVPGKYFQMVRCFRYDVIDATHLADFNQIGGFVVEEGINFRHLIGLLRLFAREFAETDEVRVVPAYFPFTEPSAAVYAKHPDMGWIELGGSGIFRPEMTHPLGVKAPVIAWGIGVERLGMFRLGLKDIRQLFSHDLEFLRSVKVV
ncbi:phenylalanine--tRNA ligase subunit alpha [Candidatus Woesearchaeota archaeon]|nr:phenylalanine--tRNA ligase subunit alpha [Candidatus Woesearchaeota archaeon]